MNNTFVFSIIYILLFFTGGSSAISDALSADLLTIRKGLSQNSGLCIIEDRQGFIWIGTQNGLNRYDGYEFKVYRHQPGDSLSLSDSYINALYESSDGSIWIGTNKGGLNKLNPQTDNFRHYRDNPEDTAGLGPGSVVAIQEDSRGRLWVGVNPSGLFFYNENEDRFMAFDLSAKMGSAKKPVRVFDIFEDREQRLWVATDAGLALLKRTSSRNYTVKFWTHNRYKTNSLPHNEIVSICADERVDPIKLWLATSGGLSRAQVISSDSLKFTNYRKFKTPENSYTSAALLSTTTDDRGRVWVGTQGLGLHFFNPETRRLIPFSEVIEEMISEQKETIRSLFRDRNGHIWVGTENSGLIIISEKKYIFNKPVKLAGGEPLNVTALAASRDGKIWVGTKYSGLIDYKPVSRIFKRREHVTADESKNGHRYIRTIYEDKAGWLWFGCWDANGGLHALNPTNDEMHHYRRDPLQPNSLPDNQVRAVAEDSSGGLWVALTEAGVARLDRKNDRFQIYRHDARDPNSISDNTVMNLYTDREGVLWLATFNGGLNRYDARKDRFICYKHEKGDENSIRSNRVWSMLEDHKNRFWVGTSAGLHRFDRERETFSSFSQKDGLCNDVVLNILEDDNGYLWLTTENGLSRFNPEHESFINFDADDGLQGNEFNPGAACRRADGKLIVGGPGGFNVFHPDSLRINARPSPLAITSFKVFSNELRADSAISAMKNMVLEYDQNFFSIGFAALGYASTKKNQYAYKLSGFNEDWIFSRDRRYVSFSHLDPGRYTFRVRSSNDDGIWADNERRLFITVKTPFWMTDWFRAISGLLIFGLIFGVIRNLATRKYRKKIHQMQITQKVQDERQRISEELHDHIGSKLSNLVTGLEIAGHATTTSGSASFREQLFNLEQHTRSTISELRQTIWTLNKQAGSLGALKEQIINYIKEQKQIYTEINISINLSDKNDVALSPLQILNIFRIAQEALHNALKYALSNQITVSVILERNHYLTLTVADDGRGFDIPAKMNEAGRFGLAGMQRRAHRLGGDLKIESAHEKGTIVTLRLDLRQESSGFESNGNGKQI